MNHQAFNPPSSFAPGYHRGQKAGPNEEGGLRAYGVDIRKKLQSFSYGQKLTLPEWKEFSHKIKVEAGWCCEECGREQGPGLNLEVHHVHYETGRLPWEYPRALVMAVCPDCHEERQAIEQRILSNVAELLRQKNIREMMDQPIYALITPTDLD